MGPYRAEGCIPKTLVQILLDSMGDLGTTNRVGVMVMSGHGVHKKNGQLDSDGLKGETVAPGGSRCPKFWSGGPTGYFCSFLVDIFKGK
jgi:hypothetical protein